MIEGSWLLDVNVLIALLDADHVHYRKAHAFFSRLDAQWGYCAFSEAGVLRIMIDPRIGGFTIQQAILALKMLSDQPRFRFWPSALQWRTVAEPFLDRIHGHQQITDAYLLGLAIKENGILVTFDKGIRHLAGERYSKNVLVLE